jgi:glucose-6-phosphate isomerase
MSFNPGLDIRPVGYPLGFSYGPGTFGPEPEVRCLEAIRASLRDAECSGPDPVYAIAMDVGTVEHEAELRRRMLLFGLVTFAAGQIGSDPVRSQGHVHRVSGHSRWRPPEVFEVWTGTAYIYMQEFAADDPGRCFAVIARPGDVVIVPPGWPHATISGEPKEQLTFGALCDREYGFEYDEVRKRRGLAWYPVLNSAGDITWEPNPAYRLGLLRICKPRAYDEFGIIPGVPLYEQIVEDFDSFQWVSKPFLAEPLWENFEP